MGGGNLEPKIMEEPKIIQRPHGYNQGAEVEELCPSITVSRRADCLGVCTDYRIRKLTPKECFRLQGVKDEDYEKVAKNQSNSSLYHLAGDSIVVNVLMAIFGKMI